MGAFSMQDPILEPFAGEVFGFTVGESTKLDGFHKIGTLIGIISVVLCLSKFRIGFDISNHNINDIIFTDIFDNFKKFRKELIKYLNFIK